MTETYSNLVQTKIEDDLKNEYIDTCLKPVEWYECTECTFITPYKVVLFYHKMAHIDNNGKYIEVTGVFVNKSYWKNVYLRKQNEFQINERYTCNHCNHKTRYLSSLKRHLLLMHAPESVIKFHECSFCTKLFKCKVRFMAHMRCRHNKNGEYNHGNGGKLFKCAQCSYETTHITNMKTHQIRKHSEQQKIEWFPCHWCTDYKSKTKSGLRQHIKFVHLKEDQIKWFKCVMCDFRAKRNYKLTTHIKTKHLPDNEIEWFECDQCDYRAKVKQDLKFHRKLKHTPDEATEWFQCNLCEYRAKAKSYLNLHERTRHGLMTQVTMAEYE